MSYTFSPVNVQNNYFVNARPGPDQFFSDLKQIIRRSNNHRCIDFFHRHEHSIRDRCRGRNPHHFRTDPDGMRYCCNRPSALQVRNQTPTSATVTTPGGYRVDVNQANQSFTITNPDGTSKYVNWGDPHEEQNGRNIGTSNQNKSFILGDGTELHTVLGDGNGGPARPGQMKFNDTLVMHSPKDGTGVVFGNVSNVNNAPGRPLTVTPLDNSFSRQFFDEQRALDKFGPYGSSLVYMDQRGAMFNGSNGQPVQNQFDLDQLDRESERNQAAARLYGGGFRPPHMEDDCYQQDNHRHRNACLQRLADMLRPFLQWPGMGGSMQMPLYQIQRPSFLQTREMGGGWLRN